MRILGKTNIKIKEIGLGGIPLQHSDQNDVIKMFDEMEKRGINFVDTARGYTVSEELIGIGIENRRDSFVLATKSMARTYEGMKKDIEISLNNLKTNYIDLYQLHNIQMKDNIDGALLALEEAKKENKIGHIGVTTHSLEVLEREVELNRFETIQFPYNIVENQGEELFKKAYEKNIGIIVMKPLAGGAIDKPQLALKYVLNNKNVSVIIPGMDSVEKVIENDSICNLEYSSQDLIDIEKIKKELNDNFCRRCGYCQPCPIGINIPLTFLCEGYYKRYGLMEWAKSRYDSMVVKPSECVGCGKCESKCPYKIKIREKLKNIAQLMEGTHE